MQRPCSGTHLVIDGSRSGILLCVEIAEGFKSPICANRSDERAHHHSLTGRRIAENGITSRRDGLRDWS
jgi:hypothetical protein